MGSVASVASVVAYMLLFVLFELVVLLVARYAQVVYKLLGNKLLNSQSHTTYHDDDHRPLSVARTSLLLRLWSLLHEADHCSCSPNPFGRTSPLLLSLARFIIRLKRLYSFNWKMHYTFVLQMR